jgi:hypothetical protein
MLQGLSRFFPHAVVLGAAAGVQLAVHWPDTRSTTWCIGRSSSADGAVLTV